MSSVCTSSNEGRRFRDVPDGGKLKAFRISPALREQSKLVEEVLFDGEEDEVSLLSIETNSSSHVLMGIRQILDATLSFDYSADLI